jgi:cytidine deaminase
MNIQLNDLTDDDRALIARATSAIEESTDADGGVHTVGAAVRDSDGRVHIGVNRGLAGAVTA